MAYYLVHSMYTLFIIGSEIRPVAMRTDKEWVKERIFIHLLHGSFKFHKTMIKMPIIDITYYARYTTMVSIYFTAIFTNR